MWRPKWSVLSPCVCVSLSSPSVAAAFSLTLTHCAPAGFARQIEKQKVLAVVERRIGLLQTSLSQAKKLREASNLQHPVLAILQVIPAVPGHRPLTLTRRCVLHRAIGRSVA